MGIPQEPRYPQEYRGNGFKNAVSSRGTVGMVMLLSGTVGSGFTCIPAEMDRAMS